MLHTKKMRIVKKFREAMANWEEEKRKIRDNIENDNRNTFISFQKDPAAHYPPQPQPNLDNEGPKFDERAPIIKSRNTGRNAEVIGRNRTHRAEKRARDAAQDATETTSAIPGNLVTLRKRTLSQIKELLSFTPISPNATALSLSIHHGVFLMP